MFKKICFVAISLTLLVGGYQPAKAQQSGIAIEVPDINNFAGLGIGFAPDYFGSDEYTVGIAPTLRLQLGNGERYFRLLANEAALNILDNPKWSFGPLLSYRFPREDVDDPVISRMTDISGTLEAGAFLGWKYVNKSDPRNRFTVGLDFLHDIGGEHDGYLVSARARYWYPFGRALTGSIGVGATYGSENYNDTYFSVNASNVGTSGLPFFNAGSGMRDVRISPTLVLSLSPKWHIGAGLVISKLVGDAADSPTVDTRGSTTHLIGGIGVIYAW